MLQQTTVTAVVPYYERFLQQFPTVRKLAQANEQDVLKLWEGLGYYTRARNICKTAALIVHDYHGRFPDNLDALIRLPGIGRYTAGAIASFAFNRRTPIVEANTLRLYCRLLGFRDDPRSGPGQRQLWHFAERILPRRAPGRFNQALMELGAMVCKPNEPDCGHCPLRSCCRAYIDNAQAEIPVPPSLPKITSVTEATVAIHGEAGYVLIRHSEGQRWSGMWDFPRFSIESVVDSSVTSNPMAKNSLVSARLRKHIERKVLTITGLSVGGLDLLTKIRHSVTRFRITLLCFRAELRSEALNRATQDCRWIRTKRFGDLPFSVAGRKFANLLAEVD